MIEACKMSSAAQTGEKIVAVIPIRGADDEFKEGGHPMLGNKPLVEYTFQAAKDSQLVDRIIVSSESEAIADFCRQYSVEVPFIRPVALSESGATVTDCYFTVLTG
jgi:CMP-N,N'-diacetyllegionaminic acid synthase